MDKSAPPPYEYANAPANGSQTYQPSVHGQPAYGPAYQPPVRGQPAYGPIYQPPVHRQPAYGPSFPVQQPTTVVVTSLGPESTRMTCPHCHALIDTAIQSDLSVIGWLSALLLLPSSCCCIPCCIDNCYDVKHNCPNCRAYLGEYRRNL